MADRFGIDAALLPLLPPDVARDYGSVVLAQSAGQIAASLFPEMVRPRAKLRKMMQCTDAGSFPDGKGCGFFRCPRCGRDSGWVYASRTDMRRGIPCEPCTNGEPRPAR